MLSVFGLGLTGMGDRERGEELGVGGPEKRLSSTPDSGLGTLELTMSRGVAHLGKKSLDDGA